MTWLIILIIAIVLIILFLVAKTIIANYFYDIALARYPKHGGFSGGNALEKSGVQKKRQLDFRPEWVDESDAKEVTIESFDGLKLYAKIIENTNTDKFVLLCHCYRSSASFAGSSAVCFFEKGYSCLIPSFRGHDKSDGDYIGMGWPDRMDARDWILYLNKHYNSPKIVLYGVSMGAATVMNTVGEDLPENVFCAIEDCGYSSIKLQFEHVLGKMLHLCTAPILRISRSTIKKHTGIDIFTEGDSLEQLKKATVPMLFIHGTEDKFVPFNMLQMNYDAHPGIKQKIIVKDAVHASCQFDGGKQYWDAVFDFIDKCAENNVNIDNMTQLDLVISPENKKED